MKIRTKLALLLAAALVVTTVASTVLQLVWTGRVLEAQVRRQAVESAESIKADLEKLIKDDTDDDDLAELLKDEQRRHRVAYIKLDFIDAEDKTVSFALGFQEEEPKIKKSTPNMVRKKPGLRRDEIRRALLEHGGTSRPPTERFVEPLWRTPDRNESRQWASLAARVPPPKPAPRPVVVDERDAEQRLARYVQYDVELTQPRRALVQIRLLLDWTEQLRSINLIVSGTVTLLALILMVALSAVIANRIVGRPVAELSLAMRKVGEGDLSAHVQRPGADEIGQLGRGFNAMIDRLAVADEEIRAFNRRLADEVAAATADLARKNAALAQLNRLLLEARRELGDKERLAALGQLAAQLAHEIGTPLGSVSGYIQLALSARDLPPAVKERLVVATKEVERVGKIVRDYLDSTRPIKPASVETDLPRLIDEAAGIALGAAQRPGPLVEKRVSPHIATIDTDPGLLRQILLNLMTNAVDAVGASGHIVVEAEPAASSPASSAPGLSGAAGFDAVLIRVIDDGMGIAPEDAARIFEPFYTTKGRGKGTGLGLAICRELATALGGQLSVESRPGVGSTFTLRLPLGRRAQRSITLPTLPAAAAQRA